MSAEKNQIGILSNFDAADAIIDSELNRRIQCDHLQRVVFRELAVVVMIDAARFLVEAGHALIVIRVDRNIDAELVHDRVGSIEVGKDADLVLFSAHPLSSYATVEKTF